MNTPIRFEGRLAVQQRVLPEYRVPFFETLAQGCAGGFSLFAGEPRPDEAIKTAASLSAGVLVPARNRHLLGGRFYLCYQPGILRWLEQWQPDALVVEANSRYPNTRSAVRWMHARNRPVLGWGLGAPAITGALAGVREMMRRRFLSELDGLIAYSERGASEYRALGIPEERVFVAHNAAAPRPDAPPPARGPLDGRATVLFVGRLQARKRLERLFVACAALPESVQPELVVVGDGPEREWFEAQAQALYPRTQFAGAVHGEALQPYFSRADLFVLPGTGGLAVQQAMAHALPVIVARGDGTQEDLVGPNNGWLIRPDDQGALEAALKEALADPQWLRQMGAESYRIAAEEINLDVMAAEFLQAVNTVRERLRN